MPDRQGVTPLPNRLVLATLAWPETHKPFSSLPGQTFRFEAPDHTTTRLHDAHHQPRTTRHLINMRTFCRLSLFALRRLLVLVLTGYSSQDRPQRDQGDVRLHRTRTRACPSTRIRPTTTIRFAQPRLTDGCNVVTFEPLEVRSVLRLH